MDRILYSPKEGTTGFWGLRDYPEEPTNVNVFQAKSMRKFREYEYALESCKSNKLEIVNPEVTGVTVYDLSLLKPGDIFDLPIGYEFKEETFCAKCKHPFCDNLDHLEDLKVLRLVKTETKDLLSVLNKKADQLDSEHRARTTFTADQLQVKVGPQPEPEESQKLYTLNEVKEILHNHHCDQFKMPRNTVFPEPNWTSEWIDKNLIQRRKQ